MSIKELLYRIELSDSTCLDLAIAKYDMIKIEKLKHLLKLFGLDMFYRGPIMTPISSNPWFLNCQLVWNVFITLERDQGF